MGIIKVYLKGARVGETEEQKENVCVRRKLTLRYIRKLRRQTQTGEAQ